MKRNDYNGVIKTRKQFIVDEIANGAKPERKDGVISYYGSKWNRKESKPKTTFAIIKKLERDIDKKENKRKE